jgi:pimeloyl-ACP methyl ester carboxylesterase
MVGDQVRYCTVGGHRLGRLVRIPGAGHFIQEDEPEKTAAAILNFLGGTGG